MPWLTKKSLYKLFEEKVTGDDRVQLHCTNNPTKITRNYTFLYVWYLGARGVMRCPSLREHFHSYWYMKSTYTFIVVTCLNLVSIQFSCVSLFARVVFFRSIKKSSLGISQSSHMLDILFMNMSSSNVNVSVGKKLGLKEPHQKNLLDKTV